MNKPNLERIIMETDRNYFEDAKSVVFLAVVAVAVGLTVSAVGNKVYSLMAKRRARKLNKKIEDQILADQAN
jgi:hypothetical protein